MTMAPGNDRRFQALQSLVISALLLSSAHADPLADNQARFGKIQGTVYLLTQGAKEWIDAPEDLPIEPGDEIHAEDESTAEIILSEHALLMLQPNADLIADTISTDGGNVHLTDGTLIGRVNGEAASRLQRWEIETPGAIVQASDAVVAMTVDDKSQTYLGVLQKQISLQPAEGPQGLPPAMKLAAPQEAILRRGTPLQIQPHFSKDIQPLAALQADLVARQTRIENTWSPFTTTYRMDLRRKFVKPVAPSKSHPRPVRRRRPPVSDTGGS